MAPLNKLFIQAAVALLTAAGPMAMAEATPTHTTENPEQKHLLADGSVNGDSSEDDEKDDDWRVNLDLYGFLPLSADTTTTLNGNASTLNWDLEDIFDHLTGALTMRAAV